MPPDSFAGADKPGERFLLMKTAPLLSATILLLSSPVLSSPTGDWPNWRGPHFDGISREKIPEELPEVVFGAENEIRIILRKLLQNAVKFTGQGSVLLSADHRYLEDQMAELCFSVVDTGPGISKDLIREDRIFDAFTQGDSSLRRTHGGLGLGLSLCRSIAKLLKGSLSVESEEGRGSKFSFSIRLRVDNS